MEIHLKIVRAKKKAGSEVEINVVFLLLSLYILKEFLDPFQSN